MKTDLSPRRRQIADLVGREGLAYRQVAERLGIAVGTVRNHAAAIGQAMGMPPRKAIVAYLERGLPQPPPRPDPAPPRPDIDPFDDATPTSLGGVTLTERQAQVARLVATGLTYKSIGRRLGGISEKTVSVHVQAICDAVGRTTNVGARTFVARWYHDVRGSAPASPRSCVYFIQAENGLVKIGLSSDPVARLQALQAMSPVPVRLLGTVEGDRSTEADLHAKFWRLRTRGEWFEPGDDLIAEIGRLTGASEEAA